MDLKIGLMVLGLLSFSCDDESNGVATNLPMIQPPVEESMPEGLKNASSLTLNGTALTALQTLLTEEAMDQY